MIASLVIVTKVWKFLNSKLFLGLLSGLFMMSAIFLSNKLTDAKYRNDLLRDEITVKTTETIKYQNKLGQEVTKVIEYVQTIDQLECSKDSLEQVVYKTIKASKLKERQLNDAYVIELKSTNSKVFDSVRYVYDTMNYVKSKEAVEVKFFNDGFLEANIYDNRIDYNYNEQIVLLDAKRALDRKFFLWRWIGWKKIVDRDVVEIVSNNPNSKLNGRKIKIQ